MRCPQCQYENPIQAQGCGRCGVAFAGSCRACGAPMTRDAAACSECGRRVEARTRPAPAPHSYTPPRIAEKILAARPALEGERKQVTVLFADIEGSMDMAEQLDPEQWHRIMNRFFQLLVEGIYRYEGTVTQYTGDGIMALFGAPIAHEDHAQRACHAAMCLRDLLRPYAATLKREHGFDLSVRFGLNSGEVVVGKIGNDLKMDYTAQGHTVGLAARIEQLAEADRVYLSEHSARLVQGFFQLKDLGTFVIKGVRHPVRVYELEGTGPLRTRIDLSRSRGFSRFVGRADEMATLDTALALAGRGRGQVVCIVGEAGVGKSRLCVEFVERCRNQDLTVHEVHCQARGKAVPFLAVRDMVARVCAISDGDDDTAMRDKVAAHLHAPARALDASALDASALDARALDEAISLAFDLFGVSERDRPAPAFDSETHREALARLIGQLVRNPAATAAQVWLIDDVQWIDPASDAVLGSLVEAVADTHTVLLLNFRPEYQADWMAKPGYQSVPLSPLGPQATDDLLRELLGEDPSVASLSEAIRERTLGNPFFIEEIVRSLIDAGVLVAVPAAAAAPRPYLRLAQPGAQVQIPANVQAVLASRIDRLGEREKMVLQTAAVVGPRVAADVLEHVAGLPTDTLAASLAVLQLAELIYAAPPPASGYVFKHPLTHEVAYHSQLVERRVQLHAEVAVALETIHADRLGAFADVLAHHWEAANARHKAARWRRRAALKVTQIVPRRHVPR